MTWSVKLNGRTYTDDDFAGNNYVTGLPSAFADLVAHAASVYRTASTTPLTIGLGAHALTVDAQRPIGVGAPLRMASLADPSGTWMDVVVTDYDSETGDMSVQAVRVSGAGEHADWEIYLAGAQGSQGIEGDIGPAGPQGPQGTQGDIGPAGPQGPQGDPGLVQSVVAGGGVSVDAADPANPVVSAPRQGRNLVINGSLRVNQRAFGGGALAVGAYGHDRWKAGAGGADYTVAAGVVTLAYGSLVQVVENPHVAGQVTLSASVSAGAVTGSINGTSGPLPLTVVVADGDITVELSGDGAQFSAVQLEVGSAATGYEVRPEAEEEILCCRYYYRNVGSAYGRHADGYWSGALTAYVDKRLPVPMRASPAFSYSGDYLLISGGALLVPISMSLNEYSKNTVTLVVSVASGGTAGYAACLCSNNDTGAWTAFDAEF